MHDLLCIEQNLLNTLCWNIRPLLQRLRISLNLALRQLIN